MSETNSAFERFDSVPTATRDEFNVIEAKKLQFKKLVCNRVFVSAVILVLSLAIILFALFMPLSRSFALADDFEVDIKYTGIDVFRLFYHSVLSLSYEEMMETPLYAETMQESLLFMEQGGSFDSLSFKQERLLSSITEKTLLLTVSSEDCGIRFQVIIAALSLVSVLVISAVMMYFSGFALYSELQSKGKNEESVALLFKKQLHALWIFTLFAPAFIYSFFTMANWGLGSNLYVFSAGGAGLSVGSVFLLVFSVAVSLLSVVHLVLKNKKRFPRPDSTVRKKTALIIALLLLMISVFLPILSVTFTKNGGKTESKSFFIDSFGIVTGADIRYFQSTTRDQNKQALNQVANDIFDKTSSPKMLTNNFMHKLLFGVQRSDMSDTYIFIQLISYAIIFICAILIVYLARSIFEKLSCRTAITRLRIILALLVTVEFILGVLVLSTANQALGYGLTQTMSIEIGIGPILSVVLAAFVLFFKLTRKIVKNSYADGWYDNADVSYAPYVIKASKKN